MSSNVVKIPGPDHPISIAPHDGNVIVRLGDKVLARTQRALVLKEASYPSVFYVPREDADMAQFLRSPHHSHCPYKGEASYFDLGQGEAGRNAVWSYETPHAAVAAIKGHLAFYPDRVQIES